MANSTATMTVNLAYTGPGGNAVTEPAQTVLASYQSSNVAYTDVPSGTTGAVEFVIPFGTVGAATCVVVKNGCTKPVDFRPCGATGGDPGFSIPAGGVFTYAFAGTGVTGASGAITSASVFTTAYSTGAAQISSWVFGDPV